MRLLLLSALTLATVLGAQQTKKPAKSKAPAHAPATAKAADAKATDTKPAEPLITPSIATQWTVPGFSKPESALWDAEGKVWYVTNMADGEMSHASRGFIALLDRNGLITTLEWVKGLNAPKGMGLVGRTLYVADIDALVAVDVAKGSVVARFPVAGAKFLNDVAASPAGDIYISDTLGNAIFVLRKGAKAVETFGRGPQMDGPNGLLMRDGKLLMAGWGRISNAATFETSVKGSLHRIDLKTRAVSALTREPLGNLDGLEAFGKHLLVTDWSGGKLFLVDDAGAKVLVKDGFKNPADIGVDGARHLVAVPETGGGQVTFLVLN